MSITEISTVKIGIMPSQSLSFQTPPRSRLYALAPCGLGTVRQESLISYLNRLAWRHHIPPRRLVAQEILPFLSHSYSRHQLSGFSWGSAGSINGNGHIAREWAAVLENLTTRSDLSLLTSQHWVGDLTPNQLLREKPVWCPECLTEWKDQKMPIYEPLLWAFQVVTMCMKHHRKLEDHCPHCQKRQPFIRFQADLGHCTRCNMWLGSSASSELLPDLEVIEQQKWVMHALEELHSAGVSSGIPPWEQFFTSLSQSFGTRGEQSRLAELVGVARGNFALWLNRSQTPTLETILKLCYACNISPLQILKGNIIPLKQIIQEGKTPRQPLPRRARRHVDREQCLERIQAVLDGQEEPIGYVEIAKQLGYRKSTLEYLFPQECALLTKQIKEHRRQRKEQRVAKVQEEVRQAVLTLHEQGIYPSQNKVGELLPNANVLFQPEASATWRTLCRELGWDRGNKAKR